MAMSRWPLVVALLLVVAGFFAGAWRASADQLAIWTDRAEYHIGDGIRYCVSLPGPGQVQVIDRLPNGQSNVLATWYDSGAGRCTHGQVTPPSGQECLQVIYTPYTYGQSFSTQTCFLVHGSHGGGVARARVWTDRSTYTVGSTGRLCWDVSQPGWLVITDVAWDGTTTTPVNQSVGAGRQCRVVSFQPPLGTDTLTLVLYQDNSIVAGDTHTYSVVAKRRRW
jgi:hypothetical protein